MLFDLHVHYPMHLVPQAGADGGRWGAATPDARAWRRDRLRARLVGFAGRLANYERFSSGPRVTVPLMREGGMTAACSVLYSPFDEMDLSQPYGAPPTASYFPRLVRQLDLVERELARCHAGEAKVVRNRAELDAALVAGELALLHCVEGAFHLGATPTAVDRAVTYLARRGVLYITVAHLFWRGTATNTPALPWLPDRLYPRLFPQPAVGLTELGRAAVRAMVREGVLIDLTHMSERALADTFALLDELDPGSTVPVLLSHTAYRFGTLECNASEEAIARVAGRGGVVGLILADHHAADGLQSAPTATLEEAVAVLCAHIDRIEAITGSHDHVAIGSDLDGFIKPMAGLENPGRFGQMARALQDRYGADTARRICVDNALGVVRSGWTRGSAAPHTRARLAHRAAH